MKENPLGPSDLPIAQAGIEDDFVIGLQAWVDEDTALEGERESRAEAMRRIIEARSNGSISLLLSELGLSSLPPQIGELKALTVLNLSGNQLTTLPNWIGNLTALTYLSLGGNQLTTLPNWIGNLTALTYLSLGGNQLTTLPESIGGLTALTDLLLDRNQLTTLPKQIGDLNALTYLDLSFNQLTTLPDSIGGLCNLISLDLRSKLDIFQNQPTPSPTLLDRLSELETRGCKIHYPNEITLQLRVDRAESRLKQTARTLLLGNLDPKSKLSKLDTGIIHEVLGFISSHQLSEEKKKEILEAAEEDLKQTEMYERHVGADSIEGDFLTGLQAWVDEDTALEGEKEQRVEAMQRIMEAKSNGSIVLSLSGLGLSSLPKQIGDLTALTELRLRGNLLTTLPESIGGLTALTSLDLSGNRLNTLPEQIGNLTALTNLYLSGNRLTTLPEQIGNLTALTLLYLGFNRLISLPNSIFTNQARTSDININAENNRFLAEEALRLNTLAQQNPLVRLGINIYEPLVAARAAKHTTPTEIIKQSVEETEVTESNFNMSQSSLDNTAEAITSEEYKYKSDSDEESRSPSHQGAGGAAEQEGEEKSAINEASVERAEEPRVGPTARRTVMGRVYDAFSSIIPKTSVFTSKKPAKPLEKGDKNPLHHK